MNFPPEKNETQIVTHQITVSQPHLKYICRKKSLYHCDEQERFIKMCIKFMEQSNPQKASTTLSNFLKRYMYTVCMQYTNVHTYVDCVYYVYKSV